MGLGKKILTAFLGGIIALFCLKTSDEEEIKIKRVLETPTRLVEISDFTARDALTKSYDDVEIDADDCGVSFKGKLIPTNKAFNFINEISYIDVNENSNISIGCEFLMDEMKFIFKINSVDENNNICETQTIETDAFVTENGGLDAYVELNEENCFYISEYSKNGIENDGILDALLAAVVIVAVVVVVYVAVAETAEQVRSKSNYKYNRDLETSGQGVALGKYITNQKNKSINGKKCGSYKFGFTEFVDVGCEVASVYNLLISLGKSEYLSETIRTFEKKCIEYSIGWGTLGSNPKDIYRILNDRKISYTKYTSFDNLQKAVDKKSSCKIIMSQWSDSNRAPLHTFFINKSSNSTFNGYNYKYIEGTTPGSSLSTFRNRGGFIVGYVI